MLAAWVRFLERERPEQMCLWLGYIQHRHAPGSPGATAFYAMTDSFVAQLDTLGATYVTPRTTG